jgi:uncharacterized protein with PQ loop repeat
MDMHTQSNKTFFDDGQVFISSDVLRVGDTRYRMNNISSYKVKSFTIPADNRKRSNGVILVVIGAILIVPLALLSLITRNFMQAAGFVLVIFLVCVAPFLIFGILTIRKHPLAYPTKAWKLMITTNAGEKEALVGVDEHKMKAVEKALDEASAFAR